MEPIISKEEFDELVKIKGEIRGIALKGTAKFILEEKGEEGLKKLEDTITKLGYPLKFKRIKKMDFYPLGLDPIINLSMKRLFNYDNEKFYEIGRFSSKFPVPIRLFMKYLVSIDKLVKEVPKMWRTYFTVGDLKTIEHDEKKRYMILRIENFYVHPLNCEIIKGYFSAILEIVVKKPVTLKETKCVYRGAKYHEFLLKW